MTRAPALSIILTLVTGFVFCAAPAFAAALSHPGAAPCDTTLRDCLATAMTEDTVEPATKGPRDERVKINADNVNSAIATVLKDGFEPASGSPGNCPYPDTASDTFVEGEPMPAFSWPMADDLANGTGPLDLVEVACDTDSARSWSGIDFLLFVSFDAWDPRSQQHVVSIAALEDDFVAARAAIVWVLESDSFTRPGTLEECTEELQGRATTGFCVGDVDTQPDARAFQDSPFAVARGFTAIVRRSDMRIEFVTTHGTPSGNENLTGGEVLDALRTL